MILAAVMPAPRVPVEIREFPEPALPVGGALLRTALSEVCGTDVHLWHGRLAGVPYPIIPGHVTTGTLHAVRGSVAGADGAPLAEGDAITELRSIAGERRDQRRRLAIGGDRPAGALPDLAERRRHAALPAWWRLAARSPR